MIWPQDAAMFEVSVESRFVARHQLCLPATGPEPLHEHDWTVRVTVVGERLDDAGVLVDFGLLRRLIGDVLRPLDGQDLNTLPAFEEGNPSAEKVAFHVAGQVRRQLPESVHLAHVEVEEERGCVARFSPAR